MKACKDGIVPLVEYLCREAPSILIGGSLFVTEEECVDVIDINRHKDEIGTKYARIYSAISCATKYGQIDIVKVVLSIDWAPNVIAYSASLAIRYDHDDIFALLLPRVPQTHPYCLLSQALVRRNATIVKMLLERGSDPNVPYAVKGASGTCLSHAIETLQDEAVEHLLLYGADPSFNDGIALRAAAQHNPKWFNQLVSSTIHPL